MTINAVSPRSVEPLSGETRLMLRAAQLYYRLNLTQDQVGERLGVSRFKVGRLLDRALRESAVRIEIVHPAARLIELEDALTDRFGLRGSVVVDVAATGSAPDDELLARERVAGAAAAHLASLRPAGVIGVSWGRTMLELAAHLRPGWTAATEIVQLNGATSRSARPTRAHEIVERFGATSGAAIRLMAAPAIVGSAELRDALEEDPSVGETLAAARAAATAVFSMGVLGPDSVHVASGYLGEADLGALANAGAVGDVLGRFLSLDGRIALPSLDRRTIGLPLEELGAKALTMGLAAGAGRGPIALAALRAGCVSVLVADEATAAWCSTMRERGPGSPSPDEVRDVVRRIVDATLARDGTAGTGNAPLTGAPAPVPPAAPARVAIAIGADHGGATLKDRIGEMLTETGFTVHDCGTHGNEPVDYPDIAHAVARLVADGTCRWGIILDGAGIGSCMVANKVPGIRAALCHDLSSARNSREHNHANVLTLGARFTGEGLAIEIVRAWLGTEWGLGRHAARVEKITEVERRYTKSPGEDRAR